MDAETQSELGALRGEIESLRGLVGTLRAQIRDVEDSQYAHHGLDYGADEVDANTPHRNLSVDTIESGGATIRQDEHGMQVATNGEEDTGVFFVDQLSLDPDDLTTSGKFGGQVSVAGTLAMLQMASLQGGTLALVKAQVSNGSGLVRQETGSNAGTNLIDDGTNAYFDMQCGTRLSADISPAQIAANTDNYAPTGLATATVLRLSTDASRDLTGITGGADGRVLFIFNVGAFNLVLKDDATSTAANRFQLNGDLTLAPNESTGLWYDATDSRWRAF